MVFVCIFSGIVEKALADLSVISAVRCSDAHLNSHSQVADVFLFLEPETAGSCHSPRGRFRAARRSAHMLHLFRERDLRFCTICLLKNEAN